MNLYPLSFEDNFQERIWGGESWEVSCHPNGMSVVANGPFHGTTLHDLVKRYPEDLLGVEVSKKYASFPLLIKIIDAKEQLSVQVHPDDAQASKRSNDHGKTEAWHIIDSRAGAKLICGFKKETNKKDVAELIKSGQILQYLREFEAHPKDSIFVPAGTVHAIGPGIVLYEVQESSDITYRIYDWKRKDMSGKERQLNVNEALDVMDYHDTADHRTKPVVTKEKGFTRSICASCKFFVMERYDINSSAPREMGGSFDAITVLIGGGRIKCADGEFELVKGRSLLIPACIKKYTIDCRKDSSMIVTSVPTS